MHLTHIDLAHLCVSKANMRHGSKAPDVSNILPSVRARGVLVPLLVRPNGTGGMYEIVAGRRRYFAAQTVATEREEAIQLPCAVLDESDDASAIEASLIENIARLDPDEVSQWETFSQLVREGRSAEQIAATFGLSEDRVKRILALGNLLPAIRLLYRHQQIDVATVRHLTLANRDRQKAWLALWRNPDERAPTGQNVKHWLFGGQSIPTSVAIFDLSTYSGQIVGDLFGDDRYFSDCNAFWSAQMAAVEERKAQYLADGWKRVEILPRGEHFARWQHDKVGKTKGGAVFIAVAARGDIEVNEGWLTQREAGRTRKGELIEDRPARPELSAPLRNYVDLHRHAAVRTALLDHPGVALRLMIAHAVCGSSLWTIRADPQRAHSNEIAESVEACASETVFDEKRRTALGLIAADEQQLTIMRRMTQSELPQLFARLLTLSDSDALAVLMVVMGETLEVGSAVIDALGKHLAVDMRPMWEPDDAFFDLLRDRRVVQAILSEVGGTKAAKANEGATLKVQKNIICDCLTGSNGRAALEAWLPAWLCFPQRSYLESVSD